MASRSLVIYRTASAVAGVIPQGVAIRLAESIGSRLGPRLMPGQAQQLASHIRRVRPGLKPSEVDDLVKGGFGSYGRFWVELFTLPSVPGPMVGKRFKVEGYGHIQDVLDQGRGPILALPHLGGWEWAAAWLGRVVGLQVTAVVERLEPPDLFDWFVSVRSNNGIDVVPLGGDSASRLVKAIRQSNIVCLLSDRDVVGNGIEVEFFGEKTMLPAGPALLSRRTGTPILPTAVYYDGSDHRARVLGPIIPSPGISLRDDMARMTNELARALEELIADAPDQWHLLQPNWPSDLVTGS